MILLFVDHPLAPGLTVTAGASQAHYLANVMRLAAGDEVLVFNGGDGEWRARFEPAGKRGAALVLQVQTRPQPPPSHLDLVVALVKRARLETIVEKAAELGARRVRLAITERTNADRTNVERLAAIVAEASEQTGRLDVPEVLAPLRLEPLLQAWPDERRLMFCDEAGDARPALEALASFAGGAPAFSVLIGPEGGFAPEERAMVRALAFATPVALGPRILRADTAAISALTLWQAALGDWRA